MIYSYRRVSTEEQHNGPQAQADAIYRWRYSANLPAIPVDFFDNGISGSVPLADRPQGAAMIAALTNGDTVVTAKLDRLFRSVANASATIDDWLKRDIKLVAIYENFDMSSPMGRAMAQMASVFAELERAMIRERTKAALQAKKARGAVLGSEAPYGLTLVNCGVVTNPAEQAVIDIIVQCREAGMKRSQIAAKLNKAGYKPRRGEQWRGISVWKICRSLAKRNESGMMEA